MADGGLLVVLAHPDDESLIGGVMARYAERGVPVTMLCATRGEVGEIAEGTGATPETLGAFREQELRDACAVMGVSDVRFLPYRDSGMQGTPQNDDPRCLYKAAAADVVRAIGDVIRDVRPAVVVTWDESGGYGHPDHVAVHFHTTAAFHAARDAGGAAPAALFYAVIPVSEFVRIMAEMRKRGLMPEEAPGGTENLENLPRVPPNCIIDVAEMYDRKQQALQTHKTQLGSFDPFTMMPDDLRRGFFGREYFHRESPPVADGVMLDDLFAK